MEYFNPGRALRARDDGIKSFVSSSAFAFFHNADEPDNSRFERHAFSFAHARAHPASTMDPGAGAGVGPGAAPSASTSAPASAHDAPGMPASASSASVPSLASSASLRASLDRALSRARSAIARRDDASADSDAELEAATALLDEVVAESPLANLTDPERDSLAAALARVCVGLDGDVDAALAFLRVALVDALGLSRERARAFEALALPAPETTEAQAERIRLAAASFDADRSGDDAVGGEEDDASGARGARGARASARGRASLVAALVLFSSAAKTYDAHCAAAVRRLARALGVSWTLIGALEDALATRLRAALDDQLSGAESESRAAPADPVSRSRESESDSSFPSEPERSASSVTGVLSSLSSLGRGVFTGRGAKVGAAAVVGGAALFVTGGLAAPAIAASLASLGAAGGVVGAVAVATTSTFAYFGGAAGISVVFGGVGAGLTGWRMARRTEGLSEFAFLPVRGEGRGLACFLFVPGFLRDPADLFRTWGAVDGVYCVVVDIPPAGDDANPSASANASSSLVASARANSGASLSTSRRLSGASREGSGSDGGSSSLFVDAVEEGSIADRAGVAEGSVVVACAVDGGAPTTFAAEESSEDGRLKKNVRGEGTPRDAANGAPTRRLLAALAGLDPADPARPARKTVAVELWLRRNLDSRVDAKRLARRRRGRRALGGEDDEAEETVERVLVSARAGGDVRDAETAVETAVSTDPTVPTDSRIRREAVGKTPVCTSPSSSPSVLGAVAGVGAGALGYGVKAASTVVGLAAGVSRRVVSVVGLDAGSDGPGLPREHREKVPWPLPRGEHHVIGWEHALLVDLGGAMSEFIGKAALTSFAATRAVSYTAFHALASAVAFPVALLNSASMIDSPWALVEDRARAAGEALAEALLERRQGVRPVTLVGYSLGAKVIAACAKALIERGPNEGRGLVMDVVLVGAPLDTSEETWAPIRAVAAGRVVNAWAGDGDAEASKGASEKGKRGKTSRIERRGGAKGRDAGAGEECEEEETRDAESAEGEDAGRGGRSRDWMLRFVFRKNAMLLRRGLSAWSESEHAGVENIDVGDASFGHLDIPDDMAAILERVELER